MRKNSLLNFIFYGLFSFLLFISCGCSFFSSSNNNSINSNNSVSIIVDSNLNVSLCSTGEYIENVYFNINSKPQEIIDTIDELVLNIWNLDLNLMEDSYLIPLLVLEDNKTGIYLSYEDGIYIIFSCDEESESYLFIYSHDESTKNLIVSEIGFVGWDLENMNLSGFITYNSNSLDLTEKLGDEVLKHQELLNGLSSFISSTKFENKKENIILSGKYDGSAIKANENVDLRDYIIDGKLPLNIIINSIKIKNITFERNYNLVLEDGTEILTFSYYFSDKEEIESLLYFLNLNYVNDLSAMLHCNLYGMDLSSSLSSNMFFENNQNLISFYVGFNQFLIFQITSDNIIYLKEIRNLNFNVFDDRITSNFSSNKIKDYLDFYTSIYIAVPYI